MVQNRLTKSVKRNKNNTTRTASKEFKIRQLRKELSERQQQMASMRKSLLMSKKEHKALLNEINKRGKIKLTKSQLKALKKIKISKKGRTYFSKRYKYSNPRGKILKSFPKAYLYTQLVVKYEVLNFESQGITYPLVPMTMKWSFNRHMTNTDVQSLLAKNKTKSILFRRIRYGRHNHDRYGKAVIRITNIKRLIRPKVKPDQHVIVENYEKDFKILR